jgi:photosystem II stability/assembly factor-like uncharacterized protein
MKKLFLLVLILITQYTLLITNCSAQWYQINLPVSGSVYQMQFINSSTGWAMVKHSTYIYSLIRTTNQGTNWFVIYSDSAKVQKIQFMNDRLGYAMGESHGSLLLRTTNKGFNWSVMQSSQSYVYSGFYFVNSDTGWVSAFLFPSQVTLMTTNGFQTLQYISSGGGGTPATLYFFKENFNGQYYGYILGAGILSRTTNSGYNWQQLNFSESGDFNSFSFINKDTGWVVFYPNVGNAKIIFTSNSGQNWIQQFLSNFYLDFGTVCAINQNKIWSGNASNFILISTNGGNNWGRQSCQINYPSGIYMYDTILGFAWNTYTINNLVRTTNGGGPITNIEKISNEIPNKFILKQNYPNPFNSSTTIEFDILKTSVVILIVYDILGSEIFKIIDSKELNTGNYKTIIDFDNYNLSSGTYFYKLIAYEKTNGNNFQLTKKLVYNK